jgi:hypothetical protein
MLFDNDKDEFAQGAEAAATLARLWPSERYPLAVVKRQWFKEGVMLHMRSVMPRLLHELGLPDTPENVEILEHYVCEATRKAFEFGMNTVVKAFGDYLEYDKPPETEEK